MGRKLRVFISSTMEDLANERDAVCGRLHEMNFEPISAESWPPDGSSSWDAIRNEIESCNVFVLLLGKTYGYVPTSGPGSGTGLSVTHMEYRCARELNLPILPFPKTLKYSSSSERSDDKVARDNFRKEVGDWDKGRFWQEFSLARDLADKVGAAVVSLLVDSYQRSRILGRASTVAAKTAAIEATAEPSQRTLELPAQLVEAVRLGDAVLLAGSGISLAAGLPSAAAFSERLLQLVRERFPSYFVGPVGNSFAGTATDAESLLGREALHNAVTELVNPPQGVEPTVAHLAATRLFHHIVTTNYDTLLESAADAQHLPTRVIQGLPFPAQVPDYSIVKLHGSVLDPSGLVLTERDLATLEETRGPLWTHVRALLLSKKLVAVGTSLRDPSIIRLLSSVQGGVSGFFVTPVDDEATWHRVRSWGLQLVRAGAEEFFRSLAHAIEEDR